MAQFPKYVEQRVGVTYARDFHRMAKAGDFEDKAWKLMNKYGLELVIPEDHIRLVSGSLVRVRKEMELNKDGELMYTLQSVADSSRGRRGENLEKHGDTLEPATLSSSSREEKAKQNEVYKQAKKCFHKAIWATPTDQAVKDAMHTCAFRGNWIRMWWSPLTLAALILLMWEPKRSHTFKAERER
eukprot:gene25137-31556_t